ncbi:MAG: 2-octaprenyl-3-methyl-6-methoxy-1,4-benzoquinol hydroxylase [Paraglaciecola sp.]|jgi:2-octaprenyl-3-methyl-6-methoxy-1,4-benzoquinol hydroxylase
MVDLVKRKKHQVFDFCIVGGGMVGAASALGLVKLGFSVALIEPYMPAPFEASKSPDLRVSAISVASEKLLTELGAWQHIVDMRVCPYKRLSVWEKPGCRTDFDCTDIQSSHIGHIIENRVVQLGLHQALDAEPLITWYCGSKIINITCGQSPALELADGKVIQCKILIGADGANSQVREAAKIGTQGWQYTQQVLAIQINTHAPQQDITWQQFTPNGPLAFLPLYEGYASLVWYHQSDHIRQLKNLSKQKLKEQILLNFPSELGDFEVLEHASFPISRMHAHQYVKGNVVLIGDAAHCINPLAGQGVNLGFKDVAALVDVFNQSAVIDNADILQSYERKRRRDNLIMMSAMDAIYTTFSSTNLVLNALRNVGLKLANKSGPIKRQVMKYAMGL